MAMAKNTNVRLIDDNLPVEKYFDSSKAFDFVKQLYILLKSNKLCFLSGSFVIEDPQLKLFNSLIDINSNGISKLDLTRNNLLTSTHSVFLRKSVFTKKRQTSRISNPYKLDDVFINTYCKIKAKVVQKAGLRKEVLLQYQRVIVKDTDNLQYLCDDCCLNKTDYPKLDVCTDLYCKNNMETKGVILFYPFKIYNEKDPNDYKIYLFFKLEGYEAISYKHMKAAQNRYVLHKLKKQTHIIRREDDKIKIKKKIDYLVCFILNQKHQKHQKHQKQI